MIQIITKRECDPKEEFTGIWINKISGSIFIWADKPVVIGHAKDGKMVRADVFKCEFRHEGKRNLQKYEYEFDYAGLPVLVVARVEDFDFLGGSVGIYFGDKYGSVESAGDWLVAQDGNVRLGEKLKIRCVPEKGIRNADIIVLTYE